MTRAHRPDSEQISALAGGELDAKDAAEIRGAIDADEGLQADYDSLVAITDLLATTPALLPPRDYTASLPPVTVAPRWMRWTPTLLATAAVALLAFALVDLQGSRLGQTGRSASIVETQIEMAAAPQAASATVSDSPASVAAARQATGARVSETELTAVAESETSIATEAPAPVSQAEATTESADEPATTGGTEATTGEEPAVEAKTVAQTAAGDATAADETLADGVDEEATALDTPVVAAMAESVAAVPPDSESDSGVLSVATDSELVLDPVWLAALAAGGALLIAAGFAYAFRPR